MTNAPISEMTFEQAMAELETLVTKLEGSQVALDDSIKLYERGAELKKFCEAKLKSAQEKVEQLTFDTNGQPNGTKPVEG